MNLNPFIKHRLLTIILIGLFSQTTFAQNAVINDVQKDGNNLRILYDLNGSGDFEINLLITLDNGKTWKGPLNQVTGDVGPSVFSGKGKEMLWDVLSEGYSLTDKMSVRFKIESSIGLREKERIRKKNDEEAANRDREGKRIAAQQVAAQIKEAERIRIERERKRQQRADRIKRRDSRFDIFGYTFSSITPYNISYNILDGQDVMGQIGIEIGRGLFYDTDYRIRNGGDVYYNGDKINNLTTVRSNDFVFSNLSSKFSLGHQVFWPVFFRYGFYVNYMALSDGNRLINCDVYEGNLLRETNIWVRDDSYKDWGGLCFGADILVGQFILIKNDFRISVSQWEGVKYNFGLGFVFKKTYYER